jgi:hypothetical protein
VSRGGHRRAQLSTKWPAPMTLALGLSITLHAHAIAPAVASACCKVLGLPEGSAHSTILVDTVGLQGSANWAGGLGR